MDNQYINNEDEDDDYDIDENVTRSRTRTFGGDDNSQTINDDEEEEEDEEIVLKRKEKQVYLKSEILNKQYLPQYFEQHLISLNNKGTNIGMYNIYML